MARWHMSSGDIELVLIPGLSILVEVIARRVWIPLPVAGGIQVVCRIHKKSSAARHEAIVSSITHRLLGFFSPENQIVLDAHAPFMSFRRVVSSELRLISRAATFLLVNHQRVTSP